MDSEGSDPRKGKVVRNSKSGMTVNSVSMENRTRDSGALEAEDDMEEDPEEARKDSTNLACEEVILQRGKQTPETALPPNSPDIFSSVPNIFLPESANEKRINNSSFG